MNIKDIHVAVKNLVESKFNISCYSRDSQEVYEKPCFYIELNLDSIQRDNKQYDDYNVQIEITYVATKRDDILYYQIIELMRGLFTHTLKVGNRVLHINSFNYNYVGDNDEQIVFDFDTTFKDFNAMTDNNSLMQDIDLQIIEGR